MTTTQFHIIMIIIIKTGQYRVIFTSNTDDWQLTNFLQNRFRENWSKYSLNVSSVFIFNLLSLYYLYAMSNLPMFCKTIRMVLFLPILFIPNPLVSNGIWVETAKLLHTMYGYIYDILYMNFLVYSYTPPIHILLFDPFIHQLNNNVRGSYIKKTYLNF